MKKKNRVKIPESKWRWKGLAGHFCGASKCSFRMNTHVGNFRVSTIGAYYPNGLTEDMTEIGFNRHYETMVFPIDKQGHVLEYSELDTDGIEHKKGLNPYESDKKAEVMHLKMCRKYARKNNGL